MNSILNFVYGEKTLLKYEFKNNLYEVSEKVRTLIKNVEKQYKDSIFEIRDVGYNFIFIHCKKNSNIDDVIKVFTKNFKCSVEKHKNQNSAMITVLHLHEISDKIFEKIQYDLFLRFPDADVFTKKRSKYDNQSNSLKSIYLACDKKNSAKYQESIKKRGNFAIAAVYQANPSMQIDESKIIKNRDGYSFVIIDKVEQSYYETIVDKVNYEDKDVSIFLSPKGVETIADFTKKYPNYYLAFCIDGKIFSVFSFSDELVTQKQLRIGSCDSSEEAKSLSARLLTEVGECLVFDEKYAYTFSFFEKFALILFLIMIMLIGIYFALRRRTYLIRFFLSLLFMGVLSIFYISPMILLFYALLILSLITTNNKTLYLSGIFLFLSGFGLKAFSAYNNSIILYDLGVTYIFAGIVLLLSMFFSENIFLKKSKK